MTIEGIIERATVVTNRAGEVYYMVWTKGRKFITEDEALGQNCIENKGIYGIFQYSYMAATNTYYLDNWVKL